VGLLPSVHTTGLPRTWGPTYSDGNLTTPGRGMSPGHTAPLGSTRRRAHSPLVQPAGRHDSDSDGHDLGPSPVARQCWPLGSTRRQPCRPAPKANRPSCPNRRSESERCLPRLAEMPRVIGLAGPHRFPPGGLVCLAQLPRVIGLADPANRSGPRHNAAEVNTG